MQRQLFCALFSFFAAAVSISPVKADEYSKVHSVAIVSALGNVVNAERVGATIFGAGEFKLQMDWDLDAKLVQMAKAALAGSRFAVVDVEPAIFPAPKSGLIDESDVRKAIRAMPKKPDVDAFVVFLPTVNPVTYSSGYSFSYDVRLGIREPITFFGLWYQVVVFDAATGSRIDYGSGQRPSTDTLTGHEPPVAVCSKDMWAEKPQDFSPEQKGRLEGQYLALLGESVNYAMASAELISKADAQRATASLDISPDPTCRHAL